MLPDPSQLRESDIDIMSSQVKDYTYQLLFRDHQDGGVRLEVDPLAFLDCL